jgi:hypothetical protein
MKNLSKAEAERIDIKFHTDSNIIELNGTCMAMESYEEAGFVFDLLNRMRDTLISARRFEERVRIQVKTFVNETEREYF